MSSFFYFANGIVVWKEINFIQADIIVFRHNDDHVDADNVFVWPAERFFIAINELIIDNKSVFDQLLDNIIERLSVVVVYHSLVCHLTHPYKRVR